MAPRKSYVHLVLASQYVWPTPPRPWRPPAHPVLVCLNKLLRREYRRRQRSRGSRSCGICQTNSTYKVTYIPALVLIHLFQNFAIDTLPALVARCLRPLRLSLDASSGMQTNLVLCPCLGPLSQPVVSVQARCFPSEAVRLTSDIITLLPSRLLNTHRRLDPSIGLEAYTGTGSSGLHRYLPNCQRMLCYISLLLRPSLPAGLGIG